MIVIIPLMGVGKRFADAGYLTDKPFINANGKPIIQRVIQPLLKEYGHVHIACRKSQAITLQKMYESKDITLHVLEDSVGAADTIIQTIERIEEDGAILCVDGDTILQEDAIKKIPSSGNAIMTFKDEQRTGMYSYLDVRNDVIFDIQEKKPISSIANAGIYLFQNKQTIKDNYKYTDGKEQYLSQVVYSMLQNYCLVNAIDISNQFDCVGTPFLLENYCKKQPLLGKIFCFDLDMTLVYDVFKNPMPIQKNVDYCNYLYNNGAKIIIHTARGMLSYNGDVNNIHNIVLPHIKQVLSDCNILYDELIVGKPYADYYIDDKAIQSYRDIEKETGVYYDIDNAPREHHKIHVLDNMVVKNGNLLYEGYYYENLPTELLESYFPKIISVKSWEIQLQKITTPTFSNQFLSGTLSSKQLLKLLNTISNLHDYVSVETTDWAYTGKVYERYVNNITLYAELGISLSDINQVVDYNFNVDGSIIHGDPVFTNVFDGIKLIDPRGNWDGVASIYGDRHYDYAKILQSLIGYDFALKNVDIQYIYMGDLLKTFIDWYIQKYGAESYIELKRKTKSLILSMLPLHKEDKERCKRFVKLLNVMI